MPAVVLTRPEFGFIVATRGMLGAGIGLLAAALPHGTAPSIDAGALATVRTSVLAGG